LLNNDGEIDEDVKRALCGTFNANKIEYKIPDLANDMLALERMRLIEKNFKEKRYDVTLVAKGYPELVLYDEKKENVKLPPNYESFMKIFWTVFCSFLKTPLIDLLKDIDSAESKQFSELNVVSDIATTVLCDLAIKRGLVMKDAKGSVTLTEPGKSMVEALAEGDASKT
jgi:hypothetical protein